MAAWSAGEVIAALVLVGTPLVSIAHGVVKEVRSRRRIRLAALQREARRRPAPGTVVVEGRVVNPSGSDEVRIVTRRQFGCLGGPIVHDVPAFDLERDDGSRIRVQCGDDPVVENLQSLFESAPPPLVAPPAAPAPTGGPLSTVRLRGRVRVAGVVAESGGGFAPPSGASAVVTIVEVS